MKQRLITTLIAVVLALSSWALGTEIGGIHYELFTIDYTARVCCTGWEANPTSTAYRGNIIIPSSVIYTYTKNGITYNEHYTVTGIRAGAFRDCTDLTSVTIPNSVTFIGAEAFCNCTSLTSITIPNSVTSIDAGAFYNTGITSIFIPETVTNIAYGYGNSYPVFSGTNLSDVTINSNALMSENYTLYYWTYNTKYTYKNLSTLFGSKVKLHIGENVESIGDFVFQNCTNLTSVTIPNSVTNIGQHAFQGCTNLTSVTIGNSVTNIGQHAFSKCDGLTSVDIGSAVTNIGSGGFLRCNNLTSVNIKDIDSWYKISFESREANPLCYAKHLYINGQEITDLNIPNSVTEILPYAFNNCIGLTSVNFPNSVTSIGDEAFRNCTGLTSITIPNSVTYLGERAFEGIKLDDVTINSNIVMCKEFSSTNNLLKVFGNKVKTFTIGDNVDSIASYAFYGGTVLTSVTIGNSVKSIGNYAFNNCNNLTDITIPNSVTSIGDEAFYRCIGLTSITIPNSVTSIGNMAFHCCHGLTDIYMLNDTPPSIGENAFPDQARLQSSSPKLKAAEICTIHVPAGSRSAYEAAGYDIYRLVEEDLTDIEPLEISKEKANATYYNLQGQRISKPQRGQLVIARYSDGTSRKVLVK